LNEVALVRIPSLPSIHGCGKAVLQSDFVRRRLHQRMKPRAAFFDLQECRTAQHAGQSTVREDSHLHPPLGSSLSAWGPPSAYLPW
jgi:hypothetical protein